MSNEDDIARPPAQEFGYGDNGRAGYWFLKDYHGKGAVLCSQPTSNQNRSQRPREKESSRVPLGLRLLAARLRRKL